MAQNRLMNSMDASDLTLLRRVQSQRKSTEPGVDVRSCAYCRKPLPTYCRRFCSRKCSDADARVMPK